MKRIAIFAVLGLLLTGAPALAGGKNGLSIGAGIGVSTGKGGLVGSLLGGKTNAVAAVEASAGKGGLLGGLKAGGVLNASTGKGGLLGALIGGHGGKGGYGHGRSGY